MKIHSHDVTPAAEGEPHGSEGPTHCGSATADYEYQAEQWVIDVGTDEPSIMHCRVPERARQWVRKGDTKEFVEVPWSDWVLGAEAVKALSSLLATGTPEKVQESLEMLAKMAGTTVPNGPNPRAAAETERLAQGMALALVDAIGAKD